MRAFYLDIAQWAADDPARWGPWVAPCPVRDEETSRRKARRHRKSRMDARTRERLPVLPVLVQTVTQRLQEARELLEAARPAGHGEPFTAGGQTLTRVVTRHGTAVGRIWGADPVTGKRRDLTFEEEKAFWTWAIVEVLRNTGVRIEELLEISHHSLVQYKLPTTGEIIPLLQIAPSKTDAERLLVVSPELAEVLSVIIRRVLDSTGKVPSITAYDNHEKIWNPPLPLLFQRRIAAENRRISPDVARDLLADALRDTGLIDPADGGPLRYTPHDFRRLFITDAVMNGLPPHIAQVIVGHRDINVTIGYKAVYPEEAIQSHLAFLARRRALRPTDEYRVPSDEEWQEFLGHFERRKVATGICGRAFSTPCIHEHACLRCSMHWPDPAQRHRIAEIRDNLNARIAEAEREGWLGEIEGLKISLAGADDKLAQIDRRSQPGGPVNLGMPGLPPRPPTGTRHDRPGTPQGRHLTLTAAEAAALTALLTTIDEFLRSSPAVTARRCRVPPEPRLPLPRVRGVQPHRRTVLHRPWLPLPPRQRRQCRPRSGDPMTSPSELAAGPARSCPGPLLRRSRRRAPHRPVLASPPRLHRPVHHRLPRHPRRAAHGRRRLGRRGHRPGHQPALIRGRAADAEITASLGDGIPVDLQDTLTGIDDRNIQLLITAVRHASGKRP